MTGLILGLAGRLGGAILIETVFNWRGMGRLYYDAISGTPDDGLIVALTFMFTLVYVVARLILEVLYVILDPRVRMDDGRSGSARAGQRMRPRASFGSCCTRARDASDWCWPCILCALSAWVLITYPLDYGPARWSDPTAWADYPKAAAPAWTTLFGGSSAVQRDQTATEPTSTRTSGAAQVLTYDQTFDYQQDTPPTFMSFSLGEVQFQDRAPSMAVSLIRPDGNSVVLTARRNAGHGPGSSRPTFATPTNPSGCC